MATTTIDAPAGMPFIEISREFAAPRDVLFRAHTDPELLAQWLGPRAMTMIVDHFEVRDGGRWRYVHRMEDGTEFGFHGVFHGTPSADGIVQTFEFEGAPGNVSLDRLTLEERDGRTTVRIHSTYRDPSRRATRWSRPGWSRASTKVMPDSIPCSPAWRRHRSADARHPKEERHGLRARGRGGPGVGRRPGEAVLRRADGLRRRRRPSAERGVPGRPADAARLACSITIGKGINHMSRVR